MSLARYLKFVSIVLAGGLLALVEGFGQQPVAEMAAANGEHQLRSSDQPGDPAKPLVAGTPASVGTKAADDATAKPVGDSHAATPIVPIPDALFLPSANDLSPLDQAYLDAFSILRGDNTCSRFFGGSRVIEALNELKKQLKPTYTDSGIAMRMIGTTTSFSSFKYGFSYRMFAKAEVNLRGSFYFANTFHTGASVPWIGGFSPNSREARVTILLHELGHLIQTSDKQWLLPNDGNDRSLSTKNTDRIVAVCGEQIRQLSSTSFESELQMARTAAADHALQASVQ